MVVISKGDPNEPSTGTYDSESSRRHLVVHKALVHAGRIRDKI